MREAARYNYQVRIVTRWDRRVRRVDLTPVVPIVPQKYSANQTELDSLKQECKLTDARLREAEQEVKTKDNLLKQAQEYLASIQVG